MRSILVGVFLVPVLSVAALADMIVELDLDGQPGNGPDLICATVSDYIPVDVWLHGSLALIQFVVAVCDYNGAIVFEGITYNLPFTWTTTDPIPGPPPGCWYVVATDWEGSTPIQLPWMVATMTVHAFKDNSFGDLSISLSESRWVNSDGESGGFECYIGAGVLIGATATKSLSWGSIKTLFR